MRLAENTRRKKSPSADHRTTLLGGIFATKARIDNCACAHNMANFGSLTAEIGSGVWGTPANFNDSITSWHSSSGHQLNFAALNRGCHLYSAGRPSRRALAIF